MITVSDQGGSGQHLAESAQDGSGQHISGRMLIAAAWNDKAEKNYNDP